MSAPNLTFPNESQAIERRLRLLKVFLNDLVADPALIDKLPAQPEYLDFFEPGTRPDQSPDFQTPHVDIYVMEGDASSR